MPTVLSTRLLSDAHRQLLQTADVRWMEEDFIAIIPQEFAVETVRDIVVFTSQNAVKSVLTNTKAAVLKTKPAICVGVKTKALLEQEGWEVLAWTHYAKELTAVIERDFKNKSFSFCCGNIRREVLPTFFRQHNLVFDEYEAYQTVKQPHQIQQKIDGICFYSPSGIESFLQNNSITTEVCFCIGDTTADALREITTQVVVASQPTIEATLAACLAYYK
ncbi:uroporphyrinogen-III synthase [Myroides odoratus]|uniref:Uroporphyrinogen-III synthase n=1 Tax=Myroides odoratus TaxID=256 RepID=A0A378U372_MYROD|nr:uroporphyrinogen-III synthase [Myroides odoratus]QQU03624.1 uroporphyrinogen-III synthase [Myroides odoratus]STZ69104.1 uroporphyrinogen-III synthase [Myroides odoratus]